MSRLHTKYIAIASSHLDDFVSKKRDERAAVVTAAMEEITTLAEKDGLPVPPFLQKVWSILLQPPV
jgi:hypothetical protein